MRIIVTGGSGKLGQECVRQLVEAGHEVISLDLQPPRQPLCRFMRVDFTDYGQVVECLTRIDGGWERPDAVLHLAAIPGPANASNAHLFRNNITISFNVFWAARSAGVRNIVWASSETLTGIPFDTPPPYLPIDEETPRRPETAYALGKLLDEVMAAEFCRWDPALKMIGLRYSYVKGPEDYPGFASLQDDARKQYWNFWSYIDVRDGAAAAVLALERQTTGLEVYLIASPDTVMQRPTAELLAEVFPNVPLREAVSGNRSVLSCEKARKSLGWQPQFSWRDPA